MDKNELFSISFMPENQKRALGYLGSHHGDWEEMYLKLKIDGCVGCGFCYLIWRDWFYHQSGYAEKAAVRDIEIPEEDRDEVNKAVNQCPGRAISIIETD